LTVQKWQSSDQTPVLPASKEVVLSLLENIIREHFRAPFSSSAAPGWHGSDDAKAPFFAIVTPELPKAERQLIADIRRIAGRSRSRAVLQGIGDDCAVLKMGPGRQVLVTTDLCVENVHFRRQWHSPQSVGHRCLTRGLSDIAAMGGEPVVCFLSLGLPADLPQRWVDGFLAGLGRLARRFKVALSGGDISTAQEIVADIIVVGQVPSGKAVLRSGARPGDRIYVTGALGASGAALQRLYGGQRVRPAASNRHFFPQPRLHAGEWLRQNGLATSMIDVSDGLSVDLLHICEESGVDAVIRADTVPVSPGASLELALNSGDDYELLFTANRKEKIPARVGSVPIREIGVIQRPSNKPAITLLDAAGKSRRLKPRGWQHFGKKEE
jgi:thiamine-monophosphate kinase